MKVNSNTKSHNRAFERDRGERAALSAAPQAERYVANQCRPT